VQQVQRRLLMLIQGQAGGALVQFRPELVELLEQAPPAIQTIERQFGQKLRRPGDDEIRSVRHFHIRIRLIERHFAERLADAAGRLTAKLRPQRVVLAA